MSKIEVAATGRATCRACRKLIAKGELRFGEEVGTMTRWLHLTCAEAKQPELGPMLAKYKKETPGWAAIEARAIRLARLLGVGRAPTGGRICHLCRDVIDKDTLEVDVLLDDDPTDDLTYQARGLLHLACTPAFAETDPTAHLRGRTNGLGATDRAQLGAVLRALSALDRDPRGQALEAAAVGRPDADELSVLADWLEEQGAVVERNELVQLLRARRAQRSGRQ